LPDATNIPDMDRTLTLRRTTQADLAAVDELLSLSYPRLLAPDYPPSILVMALPIISRARPELLTSGRYFIVLDGTQVVGAGGWSSHAPMQGGDAPATGHVRHVVTDHRYQRRGIGRALMARVLEDAAADGMTRMACLSTRTAVAFYTAMGFGRVKDVRVPLRPGINFPAVQMEMTLHK
jgi:GNAT superfamily N-acetyltransferase